jgi:hypothetical protein
MDKQQYSLAESKVKDLGIEPKESSFKVYGFNEWLSFRHRRGNNDDGLMSTFHPRTLIAHVLQDNPFYILNLFHEYFGHGSFCEYSLIGQKINNYEKELGSLEKEIIGEDIIEAKILTRQHPLFNQYKLLRDESQQYMMQRYEVFEGFAYWLEMYLSDDVYQKSMKRQVIQNIHVNFIDVLDNFVKHNGVKSLIDKVLNLT